MERGLQELLDELAEMVQTAKPLRFTNRVWIDRNSVYSILDGMRALLPEAIKQLRWDQMQHAEASGAPLGSSLEAGGLENILESINKLDDLVHNGAPAPLGAGRQVHVGKERLSQTFEYLRASLGPLAKEISDYRSLYPDGRDQEIEAERQEPSELLRLIDRADDLNSNAKPIPLTLEKRLDPTDLRAIVPQMRSALFRDIQQPAELEALVDKLDKILSKAKGVPFTDQVRVDSGEIFDLLDEMRVALGNALRAQAGD